MKTIHCVAALSAAILLGACSPSSPPEPVPSPRPQGISEETFSAEADDWGDAEWTATDASDKVKLKSDGETTAYELKPKADGAKLVDGTEQELARYTVDGGKLKIKDADDATLGYVVAGNARYKLEAPDQETLLYKLIRQADGDWKLERPDETLVYRIKQRDYGFEIEGPDDVSVYKIKVKGDKTSLRNAADETVLYTKDAFDPLAMACLGLDAIEDVRLRGGLAAAIDHLDIQE